MANRDYPRLHQGIFMDYPGLEPDPIEPGRDRVAERVRERVMEHTHTIEAMQRTTRMLERILDRLFEHPEVQAAYKLGGDVAVAELLASKIMGAP